MTEKPEPDILPRSRYGSQSTMDGIVDIPRFQHAAEEMVRSFAPVGAFFGDSLITFGRNLSFAHDQHFMNAFRAAGPNGIEASLVWRTFVLYWAARRGLELEGDFVEAACYTGFSARVLANALNWAGVPRSYWLYDRFAVPGDSLERLPEHDVNLYQQVRARFPETNIRVVKGAIPEIFATDVPERVSFLHIDMNNADAEIGALDWLWDRLSPGAVVVLDDYGWLAYRAQKRAEDKWFAARGKMVLELPTGQGIVIR